MNNSLDANYWNSRYDSQQTGWDIGYASPPLTQFFDQITDLTTRILIPGCGNAYEGEYLIQKGFSQVYLLDVSEKALEAFSKRCPAFPTDHLIHANFFDHQDQYDLMVEQTFFCALDPALRSQYAAHTAALLKEKGQLMGLLFNASFDRQGPPFGGTKAEYETYFEPHFKIITMELARNSIPPRAGNELFFLLERLNG